LMNWASASGGSRWIGYIGLVPALTAGPCFAVESAAPVMSAPSTHCFLAGNQTPNFKGLTPIQAACSSSRNVRVHTALLMITKTPRSAATIAHTTR